MCSNAMKRAGRFSGQPVSSSASLRLPRMRGGVNYGQAIPKPRSAVSTSRMSLAKSQGAVGLTVDIGGHRQAATGLELVHPATEIMSPTSMVVELTPHEQLTSAQKQSTGRDREVDVGNIEEDVVGTRHFDASRRRADVGHDDGSVCHRWACWPPGPSDTSGRRRLRDRCQRWHNSPAQLRCLQRSRRRSQRCCRSTTRPCWAAVTRNGPVPVVSSTVVSPLLTPPRPSLGR